MQVPGFLWVAILALIPLLVQWLGGDYFAGQAWVPWVILALGCVAKGIELARASAAARVIGAPGRGERAKRFLLG